MKNLPCIWQESSLQTGGYSNRAGGLKEEISVSASGVKDLSSFVLAPEIKGQGLLLKIAGSRGLLLNF